MHLYKKTVCHVLEKYRSVMLTLSMVLYLLPLLEMFMSEDQLNYLLALYASISIK